MGAYVYIVRCCDGSFYTGSTRGSLEDRLNQHNAGTFGGYTSTRRPVSLIYIVIGFSMPYRRSAKSSAGAEPRRKL
jgi:predicted GIY-YIG superfamily endonuclease